MKGRGGIDKGEGVLWIWGGGGLFIAGHVCHTRGHALHAVSDRGLGSVT